MTKISARTALREEGLILTGTLRGCMVIEPGAHRGNLSVAEVGSSPDGRQEERNLRERKRRGVGGGKKGIGDHFHLQSYPSTHFFQLGAT